MLIREFDVIINLNNVRSFYINRLDEEYEIMFEYNDNTVDTMGCYKKYEEAKRVFNEIIAYYNEGRRVYVVG